MDNQSSPLRKEEPFIAKKSSYTYTGVTPVTYKSESNLKSRLLKSIPTLYMICVFLVAAIPLSIATVEKFQTGTWPEWSGLGDYESPPVVIPIDPSGREDYTVQFERSKTLWDWLELLLVPAVISVGAIWFQKWSRQSTEERAQRERDISREIESTRSRENALQNYFDRMTELLLDKELRSKSSKDARAIARARTLSLLQKLKGDGMRKGSLILFLYETDLISGSRSVLPLKGADLSDIDLRGALLPGINLEGSSIMRGQLQGTHLEKAYLMDTYLEDARFSGASLIEAKLNNAYLLEADFSGADLQNAVLKEAVILENQLKTARSLSGAILPDGKPFAGESQTEDDTVTR
jgi:hypothetical protein